MSLTYRIFKNKFTGKLIYCPTGRYGNFRNNVRKLVNYLSYNIKKPYVAHVTLTVKENADEIDMENLRRVLNMIAIRLKRAGSDFKYIAVKEYQQRGAIHFHVLCIYSKPYVFPSTAEIASSWKIGFVKISSPKLGSKFNTYFNYLAKYIGKGHDYEFLEGKKSFTCSQINGLYKLTIQRLQELLSKHDIRIAESFMCTYRKVYRVIRSRVLEYWHDGMFDAWRWRWKEVSRELVIEFDTDWVYDGESTR